MKSLNNIKLIIFDCDGVLTDGRIIYNEQRIETKNFNAKDGLGLRMILNLGIEVAVITGRHSDLLAQRCKDIGITHLYQSVRHKLRIADELIENLGLTWENVAVMGDDWNDMPMMDKAAISATPADAFPDIQARVDFVTTRDGGKGAVREFIEWILKGQNRYEEAVQTLLDRFMAQ